MFAIDTGERPLIVRGGPICTSCPFFNVTEGCGVEPKDGTKKVLSRRPVDGATWATVGINGARVWIKRGHLAEMPQPPA